MALSSDLISQFSKITNDNNSDKKDATLYGTVVNIVDNGDDTKTYYVKMDGSSVETPVVSTVELNEDDRVLVAIKNHTATVTGNMTNIALGKMTEGNLRSEISQTAEKITLSAEKLEGDIATAKAEFTVEAGKIRADMTAQGDELQRLIGENSDEITDLEKRMTSAETEIVAIPGRVESTVSAKYATIETTDDLNSRLESAESSIVQLPNLIETTVSGKYADKEEFTTFKQEVNGFSFMGNGGTVKISGGDINLTGAIKFSDLTDSSSVQSQINNANNNASDALDAAESAESMASDAQDTVDGVLTTVNGITITEGSKTYLDGEMIYSNSIYADAMHLGGSLAVYRTLYGTTIGGYLGYDDGFNSDSGIGIRYSNGNTQMVCTNLAARLSYGASSPTAQFVASSSHAAIDSDSDIDITAGRHARVTGDYNVYLNAKGDGIIFQLASNSVGCFTANSFRSYPSGTNATIGVSGQRWAAVYASKVYNSSGELTTSDRNAKNSIENLPDKYIDLFDRLRPVRFKFNDGTSDRYHVGYIAQEVEEAMAASGIDSKEFGGFAREVDEDGNILCMLRYDEFDGVRDLKIKRLENDFLAVKSENEELKARIEKLEKLLTQNT